MPFNPRPGVVAAVSSLLAVIGFLILSIYTPSGLMVDVSTTISSSPVSAVSAQVVTPYLPAGPTIKVTIYAALPGIPITHISAMLELTSRNQTYEFPDITQTNPFLPGGMASQTLTIIGPVSWNSDIRYPIVVSGTLLDGGKFSFVAYVNVD